MTVMCARHHCDASLCGCDTDAQFRQAQAAGKRRKAEERAAEIERIKGRLREIAVEIERLDR